MEHNRIKELREDRDISVGDSDSTFSFLSGQSGIFAWIDRYTDTVTAIETTKIKHPRH